MKRVLAVLIVLLLLAGGVRADITSNLVAHWKLDETSGTVAADSSGNGHTGTYGRAASNTTTAGIIGTAYNANGSSDVISVPTGLVNGATALTVSCWVRPTVDATANRGIIGLGQEGNRLLWLFYQTDGTLQVSGSSVGNSNDISITLAAGTLVSSTWKHVCVTWNGTTCTVYIAGASAGTDVSLAATLKGGDTLSQIGRIGTYNRLNGTLDDVRIYSRALSAADVAELYAYTGARPPYWYFDSSGCDPFKVFRTRQPLAILKTR